jgi:hypothetical protein
MYTEYQIVQKNPWWSKDETKKRIADREDLNKWECHEDNGIFVIHFIVTETNTTTRGTGSVMPSFRSYEKKIWDIRGYFCPHAGIEITKENADRIKDLNKNKIKKKLNNINTLLNEKNDKFDTDLAKDKLDQLKKYQDKMSNNNQSKYKDLIKQQLKQEIEMKNIMNKNHQETLKQILQFKNDLLKKIQEGFKTVNTNLQKAQNDRNKIQKENAKKLDTVIKQVENSVKKADEKFNEAAAERAEYNKQTAEQLKITEQELEGRIEKANKKLDEAKKDRKEKYESAKAQMEKVEQEVLKSRDESNNRFDEAKDDRDAKFKDQVQNFSEVRASQQELQKLTKEGFETAKQDRQNLYESSQQERKELLQEVKESRSDAKTRFDEAKQERDSYAEKYNNAIDKLDTSQKQQFAEALAHRKEIYTKLDDSILKSRAEAEKRFDEAAADRIAKYQSTKAQVEKVEQEVQKSRAHAQEEFDKAAAARKKYHTQTEKELGITHAKLLELRAKSDNNLKEVKQHLDKVYQDTNKTLSNINQEVEQTRKEVDANLQKAEQKFNNVYRATDEKLSNINQEVEQTRKEVVANLKKASQHRDSVDQNTSFALDQIGNQQNNSDLIEFLSGQKKSLKGELQETLKAINYESHEDILQVKTADARARGISDSKRHSLDSERTKHYNEYKEIRNNDPQSALESLDKAINTATKLAPDFYKTKKYNFEKDKSGDGDKLGIKNMLMKKYDLDEKIKQSKLDIEIKKHIKAIELQNQTLELQVIEQEVFTGNTVTNKLDELLTSLGQKWDSGWNAEIAENAEEGEANFAESRKLAKKILKIANSKKEGDDLFNKAVEQEENADNLETYKLALETYDQAMQKYQEGEGFDSRFSECIEICNDMLTVIQDRINNIGSTDYTEEIRDRTDDYVYIPNSQEDNVPELIGQVDYVVIN